MAGGLGAAFVLGRGGPQLGAPGHGGPASPAAAAMLASQAPYR